MSHTGFALAPPLRRKLPRFPAGSRVQVDAPRYRMSPCAADPTRSRTADSEASVGAALPPVRFALIVLADIFASFALLTALFAIVAANELVPVPVTSPVKVIVWSPVLTPDDVPENVPD